MKALTYSQKKWAMTGCLLLALSFNISVHMSADGSNSVDLASEKPAPVYEEVTRKDGKKFLLRYEADKKKSKVTNVIAQPLDTEGKVCTDCETFTIELGGELNKSNLNDLQEVAKNIVEKRKLKTTIKVISVSDGSSSKDEEYEEDKVTVSKTDTTLKRDLEKIKTKIKDARNAQLTAYEEASTAQSVSEQRQALQDAKQAETDKRDALVEMRQLLVKHSRKNESISPEFARAERALVKEEQQHVADNKDALILKTDLKKLIEELQIQNKAAKAQLQGDVQSQVLNKFVADFDDYVKAIASNIYTQNGPNQNGNGRVANSSGTSINGTDIRAANIDFVLPENSGSSSGGAIIAGPETNGLTPGQIEARRMSQRILQGGGSLNQNPSNRSAGRN